MKQIQSQDIIERRRKILEATERIFKRKGIEDASIRKIALEAGVITGAIYPYFDGKEEIYAELLVAAGSETALLADISVVPENAVFGSFERR